MSILYRVLERVGTGVEVIAEVGDDGVVTGKRAEFVRQMIEKMKHDYPGETLEDAIYRFRFTCRTMIGIERVELDEKT